MVPAAPRVDGCWQRGSQMLRGGAAAVVSLCALAVVGLLLVRDFELVQRNNLDGLRGELMEVKAKLQASESKGPAPPPPVAAGTVEERLVSWAPAVPSAEQQQSCAQVMTRSPQEFNRAIAVETYDPSHKERRDTGCWINCCTCLRHTEAAFDDALIHAYQKTIDGHGPPKRLVIFDIGANHGCACG